MPYAIIETGGKQYRVSQGDHLRVEILDAEPGQEVDFGAVMAVGEGQALQVGAPLLEGKAVKARVVRHGRGPRILIWKFKRRKGYSHKQGHRQDFTEVEITSIPAA
jgi:large subunit ribosomal protein L21